MTRLTRLRLPSLESIKKHIQESPTNFRLLYKIFIDESPIKSKEGDPKRRSISFNNNSKKTPDSDVDRHIKSLLKTAAKQHHENNVKDLHCTIQLMNKTIKTYGSAGRKLAMRGDAPGLLLYFQSSYEQEQHLSGDIRETLNLLGYHHPPSGSRGLRILSIDGGGMRGIVGIEVLRSLEEFTGKPIYELFDFICGVSTGAILASFIGFEKKPLTEVEHTYQSIGFKVFNQNVLEGAKGYLFNHAYYDTKLYEKILKEFVGETLTWDTCRDPRTPKVALVSTIVNEMRMAPFVFRNYTFPPGITSNYKGSTEYPIWAAVRASSAAPGYFDEIMLHDTIHLDGGILTNNASQIAIHEARKVWPNRSIQCVVSLGLGRYDPLNFSSKKLKSLSLAQKFSRIVDSATDTELVHETLNDLLPGHIYYRFNPYLSEYIQIDETRPEKMALLKEDSHMYTRRNFNKIMDVCIELNKAGLWFTFFKDTVLRQWTISRALYRYVLLRFKNQIN
ncbi:calcium-independent phospholipase A2-gamma isoform X1 [Lepeophtheirus salmonis]|uniref:Calciumindependent phospholipase A2gammalike [Apis mellifera] n=1 Tax=Lepeophtheirus salmonis TaxID=72036 RepID=A0A0K2TZT8_LEPSM|nr:calcium-independent phospholipase A2-gamma-like [Lepeophtheirus salmonis]